MVRLILLIAFIGMVAFAITAALTTMQAIARADIGKDDAPMPAKFQRVTYVLLIVLMFGVASGWLGGT